MDPAEASGPAQGGPGKAAGDFDKTKDKTVGRVSIQPAVAAGPGTDMAVVVAAVAATLKMMSWTDRLQETVAGGEPTDLKNSGRARPLRYLSEGANLGERERPLTAPRAAKRT